MSSSRGIRWGAAAAAVLVLGVAAPSRAASTPTPAPAPTAAPTGYLATASWQLLAEVNKDRRSKGLRPLAVDPKLAAAARTWSEHMAARATLAHNDPLFSRASKTRLGVRSLGENVGFNFSVAAQHRAFMDSPHHRANVELASFRVAGFAVVRDAQGHLWSTEDFGTPRS